MQGRLWNRMFAALAFLSVSFAHLPLLAQEGPNTGDVSLSAGIDFTTDYYFRGIRQEGRGFIFQPYAELGFNLFEGEDTVTSMDWFVGTWNSLHAGGPTGTDGPTVDPQLWYEADIYTGIGWTIEEIWSMGFTYTLYTSPNDSFVTVQELSFSFSVDDQAWWDIDQFTGVQPSTTIAFELDNSADLGDTEAAGSIGHRGIYWEFAIEPGYIINPEDDYVVTMSFPLTFGFSLSEYYEAVSPTAGALRENFFGYAQIGLNFNTALVFMPESYGAWEANLSFDWLTLGSTTEIINIGDDSEFIITGGFDVSY